MTSSRPRESHTYRRRTNRSAASEPRCFRLRSGVAQAAAAKGHRADGVNLSGNPGEGWRGVGVGIRLPSGKPSSNSGQPSEAVDERRLAASHG